ncbi:fungal-specific transcription factor domain-containing protein [Ilyonectria destructans]|nr:fungal-specific transcription factor domain-containing protein [Ilyonectria destructans]
MQGVRGVVSCASCRQRKLRCDRTEPCNNCVARKVECKYALATRNRPLAQRQQGSQPQLEGRLRHLEQLIGTLVAERSSSNELQSTTSNRDGSDSTMLGGPALRSSPSGQPSDSDSAALDDVRPGRIVESNSQMTFVSSDHWKAIQNEIAKVREYVELENSALPDLPDEIEPTSHDGPIILEGTCESTMDNILSDIPPRAIVDRLVSRYFNSNEPSIVAIHVQPFQKEYKRFWLDGSNVTQPWIAMLFGIMYMGTFLYVRSQDQLPESFGDPRLVMDAFRRRAAECLILSKYATHPTTYTLEALLLNIQCEFVRQPDANLGVWVLASVATRLAMRMGYHRDPKNYDQISPFHGEMRRRVWAMILQLDTLTSCQLGLPSMINASQCDTKLPRNIRNEDFDETSVALPPPRPETELTPVLYTITKARMLAVFCAIFQQVCLVRPERYEQVMALDGRLHQSYMSIPPCLRIANVEDCIMAPSDLLIKQYHLEILYHKARCILHRHHMAKSYQNPEFEYSKLSCLDAAMMLLTHQENIFKEVQAGGILFREKWFITSLEQHDFILASMIICLELSSNPQGQGPSALQMGEQSPPKYSKEQLNDAVRNSHRFWGEFKSGSVDALQAFRVLSVLLDKVASTPEPERRQDAFSIPPSSAHERNRSLCTSDGGHLSTSANLPMLQRIEDAQNPQPGFAPRLEEIGGMLNSPDLVNWDLWESYIQESRLEMEF